VFSLGGQEILIIVVVGLLLFGPDKIPQVARTIGRFTREFNKYKSMMEQTLSNEIYRAEGPTKDTMTIEERIAKAGAASGALTDAAAEKAASDAAAAAADEQPVPDEEPVSEEVPLPKTEPKAPRAPAAPRPSAAPSADEADEEEE
jgi:sec-independent protein translocase protein TatA